MLHVFTQHTHTAVFTGDLLLDGRRRDECAHLREVDGDADCTWHAEPLGHVTLEELMGTDAIVGHKHYAHLNSREYRSCFWDEKGSKERARQRVAELDRRFREKFPGVPGDIPPPECGW